MKIYLDVCCLCRPFDDQMPERIQIEATAVQEIIRRCAAREFTLIASEAIREEIEKIPDRKKRLQVEKIASVAEEHVFIDEKMVSRMYELIEAGGEPMDSLHIACAEKAGAVLLTTDDGLVTFFKSSQNIQIRRENPFVWLNGVIR